MGKKIKIAVDESSDENADKVQRGADRAAVVSRYIEEMEIPRDYDVMLDIPVSLIDSKVRDADGKVIDNYRGRSMGHQFLGSSDFLSMKNDIFKNGVRVPIIVKVSTTNDQVIVSDGRCRLTAVRTLLSESHQLGDETSVKKFSTIPCVVKTERFDRYKEEEVEDLLDDAFLTNFFKRNDSFYSESWAVGRLEAKGLTPSEIEERLGKRRSWVKERLNLALCLRDKSYGAKLKELIEEDGGVRLTKRVLSLAFAKNHVAADSVDEVYHKIQSMVNGKSDVKRSGATRQSKYSSEKLSKVLDEVQAEFDSSEVLLFVKRLREKLSIDI